jgi:hypothetical protein
VLGAVKFKRRSGTSAKRTSIFGIASKRWI